MRKINAKKRNNVQTRSGHATTTPLVVSSASDTFLKGLYSFPYLTVMQVMRLLKYSPHSLTRAQALLKTLTDHQYVHRPKLPHTVTGKAPYVYRLDRLGFAYVRDYGFDTNFRYRPSEHEQPSALGYGICKT